MCSRHICNLLLTGWGLLTFWMSCNTPHLYILKMAVRSSYLSHWLFTTAVVKLKFSCCFMKQCSWDHNSLLMHIKYFSLTLTFKSVITSVMMLFKSVIHKYYLIFPISDLNVINNSQNAENITFYESLCDCDFNIIYQQIEFWTKKLVKINFGLIININIF